MLDSADILSLLPVARTIPAEPESFVLPPPLAPTAEGRICPDCQVEMQKEASSIYVCDSCGREEIIVGSDFDYGKLGAINNYNTSDTCSNPVRIMGPSNHIFQKRFLSNNSNYGKQQYKNTEMQIKSYEAQYQGPKIPSLILRQTADYYYKVQKCYILRGKVRRGTMAACLIRKCEQSHISRQVREVATMFGVEPTDISHGEKLLDRLHSQGRIRNEPENFYFQEDRQVENFLNRFFECLSIPPEKYRLFATALVRFTIKYHIAGNSVTNSKCVGAIYVLACQVPALGLNREMIEKECCISKTTFSRFSAAVFAFLNSEEREKHKPRSRLRRIFKKNGIPLPQIAK